MTREITGQVIYVGPHAAGLGLQHNQIFANGIFQSLYTHIEKCPALGELFIPVTRFAEVNRELNFDLARNMRGKTGKFVTFYREVQNWLTQRAAKTTKQPPQTPLIIRS